MYPIIEDEPTNWEETMKEGIEEALKYNGPSTSVPIAIPSDSRRDAARALADQVEAKLLDAGEICTRKVEDLRFISIPDSKPGTVLYHLIPSYPEKDTRG